MENLEIVYLDPKELTPYMNNARMHSKKDIEAIRASIREFGFSDPIGIWSDQNYIVEGHGRQLAAIAEGLTSVPCIRLDHMTDEQRRAYALAHNKTAELSDWNFDTLNLELAGIQEIDMTALGFTEVNAETGSDWFEQRERFDNENDSEESEEYQDFVNKFEAKRTTDDCYTPDLVYDAVADWVAEEYDLNRADFVRPFYPGGDYQRYKYKESSVVVDNPPFSIFAEIVTWYTERGIKFFLFAPALSIFNRVHQCTAIALQAAVTYENGASVPTSFCTNLEPAEVAARTSPELYRRITEAAKEVRKEQVKELPKYLYPDHVVTAAIMGRWSKYGVDQKFYRADCIAIDALDEQKEEGKGIYGKGLLLSERAAAERAAAERAAAERAAAQRWSLSAREQELVKNLG